MDNKFTKLEIAGIVAAILILIMFQWRVIGAKELMASHDTLLTYSSFYYFSDSLLQGHFPYWDPYTNAGEPRFLLWQLCYFLRPTAFIWLLLAKIFHLSLFTVYHLDIFSLFTVFCIGSYLFFRKVFQSKISAYVAFLAITFSSLCATYWWQISFLLVIYTLPWILLFVFKFLEGEKKALIPLAFFLGVSLMGAHSLALIFYGLILLSAFFLTGAISRQNILPLNYKYLIGAVLILFLLVSYIFPLLSHKDDFVPFVKIISTPPGSLSKDMALTFEGLKLGVHSKIFDFFGLILPQFSKQFFANLIPWMPSQDAVMYIGLIPLVFLFIGLFWGEHKYKLGFILTAVVMMFATQGTNSFAHQFAYYFFPKFSWLDHAEFFHGFFIFSLCFFAGLGMDRILRDAQSGDKSQFKKYYILIASLSFFYFIAVGSMVAGAFIFLRKNLGVFLRQKETSGVWLAEQLSRFYPAVLEMFFYTQFFLLICLLFFHILKKNEFNYRNRIIFISFFIICDLLVISYPILNYTTIKRVIEAPEHPVKMEYSDVRLKEIKDFSWTFYIYAPGMLKQFSAYDPEERGWPAHLLELKDFYKFRTSAISDDVKNAILGISDPKLRLLNQVAVVPSEAMIGSLEKISPEQIKKSVFIEESVPPKYVPLMVAPDKINPDKNSPNGKIEVKQFDANRLTLKIFAEEDSFLYYSDGYDKYWQAFIDGKKTKIYKTNAAFKGVIMDKGEHTVMFLYNPISYKIGLYAYLLTLFGLAPAIIIYSLKKAKK